MHLPQFQFSVAQAFIQILNPSYIYYTTSSDKYKYIVLQISFNCRYVIKQVTSLDQDPRKSRAM